MERMINRRKKVLRGVTMIEVLVALAVLTSALLLGIYPVWFYAGRQALYASQENIARNMLEEQMQLFRFYNWVELTQGALANTGAPPDLVNCTAPNPMINNPNQMIFQGVQVNGMPFYRVWEVEWPESATGNASLARVRLWVYWRSGFGCRSAQAVTVINCNRGEVRTDEVDAAGAPCPQ
ncbi:MAG: hypothetical protein Kow0090_13950 [Myxococcota bacterium]